MDTPKPEPVTQEDRCEHGVRRSHHCDLCLDRDVPPGKRLADHPCYGLGLDPTGFAHRNSWPLSSAEHPYCARCGTEIEGPNNLQRAGAPLCWEPRLNHRPTERADVPGEVVERVARAIWREAAGVDDKLPERGVLCIYADDVRNLARAALAALSPQPGEGSETAKIVAWLREKVEPCRETASQIGDDDDEALIAWVTRAEIFGFVADAIERGDHLSEGSGE